MGPEKPRENVSHNQSVSSHSLTLFCCIWQHETRLDLITDVLYQHSTPSYHHRSADYLHCFTSILPPPTTIILLSTYVALPTFSSLLPPSFCCLPMLRYQHSAPSCHHHSPYAVYLHCLRNILPPPTTTTLHLLSTYTSLPASCCLPPQLYQSYPLLQPCSVYLHCFAINPPPPTTVTDFVVCLRHFTNTLPLPTTTNLLMLPTLLYQHSTSLTTTLLSTYNSLSTLLFFTNILSSSTTTNLLLSTCTALSTF